MTTASPDDFASIEALVIRELRQGVMTLISAGYWATFSGPWIPDGAALDRTAGPNDTVSVTVHTRSRPNDITLATPPLGAPRTCFYPPRKRTTA